MVDGPAGHGEIEEANLRYQRRTGMVPGESVIEQFDTLERLRSGKASRRDYDFHKPSLALHSEHAGDKPELEIYNYPGGFQEQAQGDYLSQIQWESQQADRSIASGRGNCRRLLPGYRFQLTNHPKESLNRGYLITGVVHEAEQPQVLEETSGNQGSRYHNRLTAIPDQLPYRAAPKPKPNVPGVQIAVVTGPKGEEIYTNEHAQILPKDGLMPRRPWMAVSG
jgi:type VI secretion system secreted protein VgrG